ncbi:hypothetical protein SAMD00019534_079780, partial [Acytostelium subglobosum LB1]|uniref:hypothetical protein n=1 Tax=Acytostelium subglobosum LB1 TaxID=1410327 RepID=UPI000644BC7D
FNQSHIYTYIIHLKMFKLFCAVLVLSMVATSFGLNVVPTTTVIDVPTKVTMDMCPTCVDFMGDSLDLLINIILNTYILGTCGDLCGKLPKEDEKITCDLLCGYVGIDVFIRIITDEDPDPVYMCEEMKVCPIRDGGNATISSLVVDPVNGTIGTDFNILCTFEVTSQLGTGQLMINVIDPTGFGFGGGDLLVGTQPGTYNAKFSFRAEPSEQEPFYPGEYIVQAAVCEGSCGSPHPHSRIYDLLNTTFTLTG